MPITQTQAMPQMPGGGDNTDWEAINSMAYRYPHLSYIIAAGINNTLEMHLTEYPEGFIREAFNSYKGDFTADEKELILAQLRSNPNPEENYNLPLTLDSQADRDKAKRKRQLKRQGLGDIDPQIAIKSLFEAISFKTRRIMRKALMDEVENGIKDAQGVSNILFPIELSPDTIGVKVYKNGDDIQNASEYTILPTGKYIYLTNTRSEFNIVLKVDDDFQGESLTKAQLEEMASRNDLYFLRHW